MITRKATDLMQYLKSPYGFLPVYKPKRIDNIKLSQGIRNDLYFSASLVGKSVVPMQVNYARHLDYFASGLMTYIIGPARLKKRNFVHADYEYEATIELGVRRQFNTIDGAIIDIDDTSIDEITEDSIQEALKSFNGEVSQGFFRNYYEEDVTESILDDKFPLVESIFKVSPIPPVETKIKKKQKYPYLRSIRDSVCEIKLVEYSKPFVRVAIHSRGIFDAKKFTEDLGGELNTVGSLVELVRTKEGPIALDDLRVIQPYELNVESYFHKMILLQEDYNEYLLQFDVLFQKQPNIRCLGFV